MPTMKPYSIEELTFLVSRKPYGPKVVAFAVEMMRKLEANEHKGGWSEMGIGDCLLRCSDELTELFTLCAHSNYQKPASSALSAIKMEAADVANFLMFVCDNCDGYKEVE